MNGLPENMDESFQKALHESELRLRSLVSHIPDIICLKDSQGNYLEANPAYLEAIGLPKFDFAGKNDAQLGMGSPFTSSVLLRLDIECSDEEHSCKRGEIELPTADGGRKIYDVFKVAMLDDNGEQAGSILLGRDISRRKLMESELIRMASTDFLTGIYNRGHFMSLAERELGRSERYARPFSLIFLDIDHFKRVNDLHGHAAGDKALIAFCEVCQKTIRVSDFMGRMGGEEFAVALVETSLQEALRAAERIRQAVKELSFEYAGKEISFTVSLGVTALSGNESLGELLRRADRALYTAKENGRNRVICLDAQALTTELDKAFSISEYHIDVLQELINIGVGRAAGALNQLTGSHVELDAPLIRILDPHLLLAHAQSVNDQELDIIKLCFEGSFRGTAALLFQRDSSKRLVSSLTGGMDIPISEDQLLRDTLQEVGNIVLIWITGAIGNVLGEDLQYTPLEYDTNLENMIRSAQGEVGMALLIKTLYRLEDKSVDGEIMLLFKDGDFESLVAALSRMVRGLG